MKTVNTIFKQCAEAVKLQFPECQLSEQLHATLQLTELTLRERIVQEVESAEPVKDDE